MKKKISAVLVASVISTNISPAINVFADEVLKENVISAEESVISSAKISKFDLNTYKNFERYNERYRVNKDDIVSISNNGGKYGSSSIDRAIDGNLSTYWETGKANTSTFENEVVVEFKNIENINRIAYATRQDGAKGKGYPTEFKIYASVTGNNEDFKLVSNGSHSATGNMMEFKFDTVNAKKIKFVFTKAHQDWASASELWFYREDNLLEKMSALFTNENMNEVSEEFNSIEKIEEFEKEVKEHPLYEDFKEDLENAIALIKANKIEHTAAKVSKFDPYYSDAKNEYDNFFKMSNKNISSIYVNGSHRNSSVKENIIDGNLNTYWETKTNNSSSFNNEVIFTLEEETVLDRVVYRSASNTVGFAENFAIYASQTSKGDTFELVSTGECSKTSDLMEFKFEPTNFKRIKFVFTTNSNQTATISEMMFYSKDEVRDSMTNLFTDSSKYKLNSEYKDIDKINELEEKIQKHPFKESYLEDIKLAKDLLEDSEKEYFKESTIKVSSIAQSKDLAKYNEEYKISTSEYKSVTNNGGHYGSSVLTKLYDGNKSTHWETGTSNSDTFKNEVEFTFKNIQEIEKIIMSPRQDASNKGFPLEYEIYGSLNENSNDYQLVTSGSVNNVISSECEIVFNPTKFKKLKFKFVNAYDGMAALSEMSFYKKDIVTTEVNSVFIDNLYTKVNENYDSIEEITVLEELVNKHPLKDDYMSIINLAKSIINGSTINESEIITLSQRGDENKQRNERRQIFAGGNVDVTGYYVMPGESVEVYVDADDNGILPQLVFAQVGEVDGHGNHKRSLSVGRNVITAPSGTKAFAIYFANKALPEDQSYAPKVRVSGNTLQEYPVYIQGETDPKEYINQVKNHTGANMTDIMGERYLLSVQNSEAKIAYVDRKYSPDKTNEDMERMIAIYDKLAGYDENDPNPIHRPSKALYHYKATNASGLFACNEYIHYSSDSARGVLSGAVYGWGFVHEFGHQIENSDMRLLEVTNNIYSAYIQRAFDEGKRDFSWNQGNIDKYFTYTEGTKGFGGFGVTYDYTFGLFERLLVINQIINYFGEDVYSQANRLVRENPTRYKTGNYQALITALSEASGYDLSPHFEYYNYPVDDKTKEFTAQFKTLDKKIRYITMDDYKKENNNIATFTGETKAVINNIKRESDGFTLDITTTNNNKATTAYEIYRNGEFVGLSRTNSYKDSVDTSKEYDYEIIAYDYRANESIKSDIVNTNISYKPELKGYDNITIKINEEFNPLDYIKAFTYNNEVINSENIVIIRNDVDNTKPGNYEIEYEVEDRNIKSTKTINVRVVTTYDYLSDEEWTSVQTQWGTPRRNKDIKGRVNSEVKVFEKGFGVHANGEIVYNLGEHNYENFEALVGVDNSISDQDKSSLTFKIIGDGKTLATTNVLKYTDDMVYINVPIKGVNELKIEVNDGGNGNASDHAIIANPKLITNNSKPSLQIDKDVVLKLGETINDLVGNFSADDIEDGNLTQNVVVTGQEKVNFNKPGKYVITYSVTDSDENTVVKTRTISVINKEQYTYLTDYTTKSASQGWGSLRVDKSVSGNNLRLTNENDQEVVYERGLGTHSKSTIVYDLSDKDYQLFTSYIGVDRAMYNSVASVEFEVYVDGHKVYESGLMTGRSVQKYVEINISNAKELKLVVTDGGNGNGSDHANWSDTKLYSANSTLNRDNLDNLLNEIENMDESKYTADTWNNLISIRDEVLNILSNGYNQEKINKLYEQLNKAKENLVLGVDKSDLKELLDYSNTIDKSMIGGKNHIDVRWGNFVNIKSIAESYLNDISKTQEEINSIMFYLEYAISELEIK